MEDNLSQTILIAVFVFIVTQVGLKYIIEPALSLRKSIGRISFVFLSYQSELMNARGSDELQRSIKDCAASLIEGYQSVPFYKVTAFIFGLPSKNEIFKSAGCLNLIYSSLISESGSNAHEHYTEIFANMREVKERLDIIIAYE